MTPPPLGSGFNNSGADDTTDAWDTIDWLVKNVPESNGRVGMIGSSYEGFTVVMALLHPHPALKVTAPESPMIDGWMGDDWFHYGAFANLISIKFSARPAAAARVSPTRILATTTPIFSNRVQLDPMRSPSAWINCLTGKMSQTIQVTTLSGNRKRSTN